MRSSSKKNEATNGAGVSFGFDAQTSDCEAHSSGQTEQYDLCDSFPDIGGFASTTTSSGSVAMTWTMGGGHYEGMVAVPFESAASTAPKRRRGYQSQWQDLDHDLVWRVSNAHAEGP